MKQVCFPFCGAQVSWWRVKQHPTSLCPDSHLNQQVCIPPEAQGKDVNFLQPEPCVWITNNARWWKAQRDRVQQRSHVPLYTTATHNVGMNEMHTHIAPLPPSDHLSGFPDCGYQLDNMFVFLWTSFPSAVQSLCMCVIDNKGMSSRPAQGQTFIGVTKSDTRFSLVLFVFYTWPTALSTAFSFG